MKTKRKAAASSHKYRGKQSYGIGGAVMTLGKNLLQGKKLGSGAFKGVLRAGITPGSGIGAGLGLAGALAGKSKKPWLQKVGKGLGVAGSVAGLFTGGGGAGALGGLAGKFAGSGVGQAASKFAGKFGGMDKALHGLGAGVQGAGGALPFLAQNLFQAEDGMRVRRYDDGGEVEKEPPSVDRLLEALGEDDKRALNKLLNQQHRIDMKRLEQEGNEELDADRDEQRRLDKEYRIDMRTPEADSEEGDSEEGYDYTQGSETKQRLMKLLKGGGLGLGAIGAASLAPLIYKLLKKKKDPIDSDALYHNVLDPRPGPRDPFWRQPNQSARGRNQ